MAGSRVLILGGGVGGMVTARELRKRLGEGHTVAVVDRNETHYFAPSYLWLLMGWRSPQQISRQIPRLLGSGVEFVQGQVEEIDTGASRVNVGDRDLSYDYLGNL